MSSVLTDQVSLGNVLTILSILITGWGLNNSFVSKFSRIETKVDAMWQEYTKNRSNSHEGNKYEH